MKSYPESKAYKNSLPVFVFVGLKHVWNKLEYDEYLYKWLNNLFYNLKKKNYKFLIKVYK